MKYLVFSIFLVLAGCAPQSPETKVKVSFGATIANSAFPGGLVIYGISNNGFRLSKVIPSGDEVEIAIPNGRWNFNVVGWDGLNLMEGTTHCDRKLSVDLTGSPKELSFSASAAKCALPIFGGNFDGSTFSPVRTVSCLSAKQKLLSIGGAEKIPENIQCDGTDLLPGQYQSFKFVIPEFIGNQVQSFVGGALISGCQDAGGSNSISTSINVPAGTLLNPPVYAIQAFTDQSCQDNQKDFLFPRGFNTTAAEDNEGFGKYFSSLFQTDVIISNEACTDEILAAQDAEVNLEIAAFPQIFGNDTNRGDITAGNPLIYLICRKADLEKIANYDNDANHGTKDGIYHLGRDIDLGGSNTTTLGDFQGEFKGNGYKIYNGNSPLFKRVLSHPSRDVRIADLTLESINITTAAGTNMGVLGEEIWTPAATSRVEIDNIKIIDSSIINSGATNVGGMFGSIDHSANTNDYVFIRENKVAVNITESGTDNKIGGLVGYVLGNANKTVAFEINFVGFDPNISDSFDTRNHKITLTNTDGSNSNGTIPAVSAIGGLVGLANYLEIRDFNFVISDINASENAGGMVGYAQNNVTIENSISSMYYIPDEVDPGVGCGNSSTANLCQRVGGLIALVGDSAQIGLKGNVAALKIEAHTEAVNEVGGVIGYLTSGAFSNVFMEDNRSYVDINSAGNYYGGVYGYFAPTSDNGSADIKRAYVHGSIIKNGSATGANYWGGFAGHANNLTIYDSIVDMTITADTEIGGAIGRALGTSYIEKTFLNTTITSNVSSAHSTGGAFGYMGSANNPSILNSKISTDLLFPNSPSLNPTSDSIGLVFGDTPVSDTGIINNVMQESLVVGTIFYDSPSTDYGLNTDSHFLCGSTTGTDGNCALASLGAGAGNFAGDSSAICSTINSTVQTTQGTPNLDHFLFDNDYDCVPAFVAKWKEIGLKSNDAGEWFVAGSKIEPIEVSTPSEWNALGENPVIMHKAIELTANIDFTNQEFYPLGYDPNDNSSTPFTGDLISNQYRLMNVTIPNSAHASRRGIINEIEGARIGQRKNPFKMENINIECKDVGCGLIGDANGGEIYVHAKGINFTDNSGGGLSCLGGLIGTAVTGSTTEIRQSLISGKIDADAYDNVGGLVGCNNGTSEVLLYDTGVILTKLRGNNYVGGQFGTVTSSIAPTISDTYVYLKDDPNITGTAVEADNTGNFVAGLLGNTDVNVTFINTYIDYSEMADAAKLGTNFNATAQDAFTNTPALVFTNSSVVEPVAGMSGVYGTPSSLENNQVDALGTINSNDAFIQDGDRVKLRFEVEGFEQY